MLNKNRVTEPELKTLREHIQEYWRVSSVWNGVLKAPITTKMALDTAVRLKKVKCKPLQLVAAELLDDLIKQQKKPPKTTDPQLSLLPINTSHNKEARQ